MREVGKRPFIGPPGRSRRVRRFAELSVATVSLRRPSSLTDRPEPPVRAFASLLLTGVAIVLELRRQATMFPLNIVTAVAHKSRGCSAVRYYRRRYVLLLSAPSVAVAGFSHSDVLHS